MLPCHASDQKMLHVVLEGMDNEHMKNETVLTNANLITMFDIKLLFSQA